MRIIMAMVGSVAFFIGFSFTSRRWRLSRPGQHLTLRRFSRHRPSGPPTAARRRPIGGVALVVNLKGCDPADGTPAACLVAGAEDRNALPGGARYGIVQGAPRAGGSIRHNAGPGTPREVSSRVTSTSLFRVEEAPGKGAGFVEEVESGFASGSIDGAGFDQKTQVGVDFLRRGVGDAPVVHSVST